MNCKYCGAPLDGEETLCPSCGKPVDIQEDPMDTQAASPAEDEAAVSEETASADSETAEAPEEQAAQEASEEPETSEEPVCEKKPDKMKTATLVVGILAALAIVAVLVVLLINGSKKENTEAEAQETTASESAAETEPAISYSKDADAFDEETLAQVIATCGESTMTNEKLAYYYWREFYSFMNYYGSYASYIMDTSTGLDSQYYDESTTWQQKFLNSAVDSYSTCAAAAQAAKKAGYTLSEDEQSTLDNLETNLETLAAQYSFDSADAYLQQYFGPYCNVASYRTFMEEYILGASYLQSQLSAKEVTDADLETYYADNQASYDESGLTKDDTLMVNVRHILIQPDAVELEEGDEGYEEAVQAAKDAAKVKAEDLYAQWQSGDATEDSFAALATENSQDTGSNQNGGLYENLAPGKTVETFDDWCFAEGRQAGDTGIVETDYGYHIIYFVSTGTESYWHSVVANDYQNYLYTGICTEVKEQYPAESDLTNAALYPCNVSA